MSRWIGTSVAALLVFGQAAAVERLPVETFSRGFTYDSAQISPDGTKIVVSYARDDSEVLAAVGLDDGKARIVAGVRKPDSLGDIWWKSDKRLVYRAYASNEFTNYMPVLHAVNVDSTNHILLNFNPQTDGWLTFDRIVDLNLDDPETILLSSDAEEHFLPIVYRVNVQRGQTAAVALEPTYSTAFPSSRRQLFRKAPARECRYMADLGGAVRVCVSDEEDGASRLLYRNDESSPWVELARYAFQQPSMTPIGFTGDNKRLYVLSNIGRDKRALFELDPQTRTMSQPLLEADSLDLDDAIRSSDGRRLLGVSYGDKGAGVYYFDSGLQLIHQQLNKALPGFQVNLLSESRDGKRLVLWVGDTRTPGSYYLYDAEKRQAREITAIAPWIDREKMARTRAIAFDARDGMHLNGYLTIPVGAEEKNLPLIVNVHGGPYGVRDFATFDRETQLFANRGYAVLQVNFRGSGGYGQQFRAAGEREWGRKMQTDLEDGVQWLVKRGTVDANKVGIFGGSYGGYAAMMALITAPDTYKCAVTYAGVSNLVRIVNGRTIYGSSGGRRPISRIEQDFWERVIGDRQDAAALREISPLFNVDKVKAPVLIAHGTEDYTVPLVDATDLEKALRRAGKPVEMLVVPHEGHGFFKEQSRKLLYERMDAFFGKCLPVGKGT